MAKIIDLTNSDGDLVILGRSIVLPNSSTDSQPHPFNGAMRLNPDLGVAQIFFNGTWTSLSRPNVIFTGTLGSDGTLTFVHGLSTQQFSTIKSSQVICTNSASTIKYINSAKAFIDSIDATNIVVSSGGSCPNGSYMVELDFG